jgi:hypothetical protein
MVEKSKKTHVLLIRMIPKKEWENDGKIEAATSEH